MSVSVEVSLLQSLDKGVRQLETALQALYPNPANASGVHTVTSSGTTAKLVNLGGPDAAHQWQVRRLSLGPAPGMAITIPGTFIIYRDANKAGTAGVEITRTTNLPNSATWSRDQFTIRFPSTLWLYWVGGNTGEVLIADWEIVQFLATAPTIE